MLKLALVTNSLDLIFLKMQPGGKQEVCRNPSKTTRTDCPFCEEKCVIVENYQAHLNGKHCIAPTRCRRAPKTPEDADRLLPTPINGCKQHVMTLNQIILVPGLYSIQLPPVPMAALAFVPQPPESPAELQSKMRLAFREANKKEREARAAFRKQREKEKREQAAVAQAQAAAQSEVQIDPSIQLVLDPSGMEERPSEERKDFFTRYFHTNPFSIKKESDELSKRVWLTWAEMSALFGMKHTNLEPPSA
ncbi:unnamed protein product [Coregonus sp. 'balchen']|nr:unnamed protein product [Coregonus sp. 'balchen']